MEPYPPKRVGVGEDALERRVGVDQADAGPRLARLQNLRENLLHRQADSEGLGHRTRQQRANHLLRAERQALEELRDLGVPLADGIGMGCVPR